MIGEQEEKWGTRRETQGSWVSWRPLYRFGILHSNAEGQGQIPSGKFPNTVVENV